MKVKNEYERTSSLEIWNMVVAYINKNKQFTSATGVKYDALVKDESINYKGGSGKESTDGESISKRCFISAYNEVRRLECINTKTVKPYIDKRQSPFVGLLRSVGIIE